MNLITYFIFPCCELKERTKKMSSEIMSLLLTLGESYAISDPHRMGIVKCTYAWFPPL